MLNEQQQNTKTKQDPPPCHAGAFFLDPSWKPTGLVLSSRVATSKGWGENGNALCRSFPMEASHLLLSDKQRSQHFPGSRWLPQSLTGGEEQLGDMMMEHLANIQRMMAAASVTRTAVSCRHLETTEWRCLSTHACLPNAYFIFGKNLLTCSESYANTRAIRRAWAFCFAELKLLIRERDGTGIHSG